MKRLPPFWGGSFVNCIGHALMLLGRYFGRWGYAVMYRGRCHACGDFSPHDKHCHRCRRDYGK